jgi:chaperonin GroEL
MGRLVFQPQTHQALQRGIHQIVEPVRMTLGPLPRTVAFNSSFEGEAPELLDKGSVIARRIIQLGEPDADMGAMLVRELLWRLHKLVGDATATAAVLFEAVYSAGVHYLAAGGSAVALRALLNEGAAVIAAELDRMTTYVSGEASLSRVAASLCADPALAQPLGQIFAIFDAYAQIDVRTGHGRQTRWDYVDGAYWKGGALAAELVKNGRVELENPAIILTDFTLNEPSEVAPALEAALRAGKRSLVLFAENIGTQVTAFLLANRDQAGFETIAVKTPDQYKDRIGTLSDLEVLVGGRALVQGAGNSLHGIRPKDLGEARRVWADRDYVGIAGGKGDPRQRQVRVAQLRTLVDEADDADERQRFRGRLGKLMGGSAILGVGGTTEREIKQRKLLAESAVEIMRGVVQHGVLPGGGVSLLRCRPALGQWMHGCTDADCRMAYHALLRALEAPARAILANAGCDPGEIIAQIGAGEVDFGYDVLNCRMVNLIDAGIVESAAAYKIAVQSAISTAAVALTIDVLVHTKNPATVLEPA